jgi:hypothetical protein
MGIEPPLPGTAGLASGFQELERDMASNARTWLQIQKLVPETNLAGFQNLVSGHLPDAPPRWRDERRERRNRRQRSMGPGVRAPMIDRLDRPVLGRREGGG